MSDEITIVGWFVVAFLQVWVIHNQKIIERRLISYKFFAPRRIQQLDEFTEWVSEGVELLDEYLFLPMSGDGDDDLIDKSAEEIREKFRIWERKVMLYMVMAIGVWDKSDRLKLSGYLQQLIRVLEAEFQKSPKDILIERIMKVESGEDPKTIVNAPLFDAVKRQEKIVRHVDSIVLRLLNEDEFGM